MSTGGDGFLKPRGQLAGPAAQKKLDSNFFVGGQTPESVFFSSYRVVRHQLERQRHLQSRRIRPLLVLCGGPHGELFFGLASQTVTSLQPTFPLKLTSRNPPASMAADKVKQFAALEGELEQLTSCMKAKKVRPTPTTLFSHFGTLLTANSSVVRGRRWNRQQARSLYH